MYDISRLVDNFIVSGGVSFTMWPVGLGKYRLECAQHSQDKGHAQNKKITYITPHRAFVTKYHHVGQERAYNARVESEESAEKAHDALHAGEHNGLSLIHI